MTNGRRSSDQEFTKSISTFVFPFLIAIVGFFLYQYFHGVDRMRITQSGLVRDVEVHKVEYQSLKERVSNLENRR